MAIDLAPMHPTWQFLIAYLVAGGNCVQAARPPLLQPGLAAMACTDLAWHELTLPTRPWVAHILASMVPTGKRAATHLVARKHPVLLRQLPLYHHISTLQCLILLPAEAPCRNGNSAIPARTSVANLLAAMPFARQQLFTRAATGNRRAPVRTPPPDDLLPAGARSIRSKCFAWRARARMALKDADVRAPGGVNILTLGAKGFRPLEGLGAGLAAGVGCEEMVVGGISLAPAEAGVGEVAGQGGVHGLTPRAAPGEGGGVCCRGCVGGGGRGAHPLADAREVEYGETTAAGPDGRRPPHHVVADHALHRAAGELVLDLLHQLRHRPIAPSLHRRRRRCVLTGRGRRRGSRPLRRRTAATVSCVVVLLLRRGGAVILVVAVVGTARAAAGRAGLRG